MQNGLYITPSVYNLRFEVNLPVRTSKLIFNLPRLNPSGFSANLPEAKIYSSRTSVKIFTAPSAIFFFFFFGDYAPMNRNVVYLRGICWVEEAYKIAQEL